MIVNRGKAQIAKLIGGTGQVPWYAALGSGSGTMAFTNTTLFAESGTRRALTGSPDTSAYWEVNYVYNYNATLMSGLVLREFGTFTAATAGSMWTAENFIGITFTGRNELEIQNTIWTF